jgi:hypothetical protein
MEENETFEGSEKILVKNRKLNWKVAKLERKI